MAPQPEQQARGNIDRLLEAAGWHVCDASAANIHAARGVAIREFPLPGYGFADYLLYVDGKAAGVIEAKKEGVTLTGVETQSDKYTKGLPAGLPRWSNPLPFAYQTTGIETRFTNGLDPTPRSRPVFAFHQPKLLAEWLNYIGTEVHKGFGPLFNRAATPEMRDMAISALNLRFGHLARSLEGRDYLMGERFTAADAYLFTVLNWCGFTGIDLAPWPVLRAFQARVAARPAVQQALRDEGLLK